MENLINFLVIAPYKGIADIISDLLFDQNDVHVSSYIAHDEEAIHLLSTLNVYEYDAIISRGGTASMLANNTNLPVYDVGISALDAIRAIRLAQNFEKEIAIVGFPAITRIMYTICEALQWDYPIVTVDDVDSIEQSLLELREKGYSVVVCDAVTSLIAPTLDMNAVLVTTGYETAENTVTQAIRLTKSYLKSRQEFSHLIVAVENNENSCTVISQKGEIILSSLRNNDPDGILTYIEEHKKELLLEGAEEFERSYRSGVLIFQSHPRMLHNEAYTYLYARFRERPELRKIDAVRQIVAQPTDKLDFSYYSSADPKTSTQEQINRFGRSLSPVIISGENGTGKDRAAFFMHSRSIYQNSVFYQIDCATATDKNWTYLLTHHDSPLAHNKHTLYFRQIQRMSMANFQRLLSMITDTNLHIRNRLIFSLESERKSKGHTVQYLELLLQAMRCLTMSLPPLRERPDDIPYLCTLYINRLNNKLGKQIIGFDTRALGTMKRFAWEGNLDQFQKVIEALMLVTTSSYISYENTMRQLSQENALWAGGSGTGFQFNLQQPLADITYDIVREVLKEEDGNHSKTAQRLDISRSTLWRMLKK